MMLVIPAFYMVNGSPNFFVFNGYYVVFCIMDIEIIQYKNASWF